MNHPGVLLITTVDRHAFYQRFGTGLGYLGRPRPFAARTTIGRSIRFVSRFFRAMGRGRVQELRRQLFPARST